MKNKGFTLIELLAVIVILAIIALIATPIILNIIDSTKEESVKRSIDHYMSAVTNTIAAANLKDATGGVTPERCDVATDDGISWISCFLKDGTVLDDIKVEVDGETPTSGEIYFSNGKITEINITMPDGNTYELDEKGNVVKSEEGTGESLAKVCEVLEDNDSNAVPSRGDLIVCKPMPNSAGERFYVIEANTSQIVMLTMYNLSSTTYTQDISDKDRMLSKNGIDFANSKYWSEAGYVYNEKSNAWDYINNYVSYLKNTVGLGSSTSGKLLSIEQANSLGCLNNNCSTSNFSWVVGTSYWLGSASNNGVYVMSYNSFIMDSCGLDGCYSVSNGTMAAGVRPVITIPRGNIK